MGTALNFANDKERLDALSKWAKRVVKEDVQRNIEARRSPRTGLESDMVLVPLEPSTLRPKLDRRIIVVGKDCSETGIGIVSNVPLEDELYFCEFSELTGIWLIRKVRDRDVRGSIREYGFMILDRYESYQNLRDT